MLSVGQDRVEELFELERPHIVAGSLLDCQAPPASGLTATRPDCDTKLEFSRSGRLRSNLSPYVKEGVTLF